MSTSRSTARVVAAVSIGLLAALWVVVRGPLPGIDLAIADAVAAADSAALDRIAAVWTRLGDNPPIVGGALVVGAVLLALRDGRGAAVVALPVVLATSATAVLKLLVTRGRPELGQQVEETFAWPSGHATAGLVTALVLVLLVAHRGGPWRASSVLLLPVGLGVGVSRVLLSVHWTTDVLAGWLVAVASVAVVLVLLPGPSGSAELRAGPAPAAGDDRSPRDRRP